MNTENQNRVPFPKSPLMNTEYVLADRFQINMPDEMSLTLNPGSTFRVSGFHPEHLDFQFAPGVYLRKIPRTALQGLSIQE